MSAPVDVDPWHRRNALREDQAKAKEDRYHYVLIRCDAVHMSLAGQDLAHVLMQQAGFQSSPVLLHIIRVCMVYSSGCVCVVSSRTANSKVNMASNVELILQHTT